MSAGAVVLVVVVVVGDVGTTALVVVVVAGAVVAVVVDGPPVPVVPSGAGSLNGTAALDPPITYTGVPLGTTSGNHAATYIGIRTHPCDAG